MSPRRLPPLNALRAFEAAARHLNFTKAAEELFVTQAAVSHQIKALEGWLGRPLFHRRGRAVYLSEDGQILMRAASEALDLLANAIAGLARRRESGVLTVSVLPSFASKWLVPRLGDFSRLHTDIDLRLSASHENADFQNSDIDVAIRAVTAGRTEFPGLTAIRLMSEILFPVCAPHLAVGPRALEEAADLRHHTLLHDADARDDWMVWLRAAGVEISDIDPLRGPRFDDSSMTLQAAVQGQGVALGRSALVADDLAAGRLVRPFDVSLPWDFVYHIVYPQGDGDIPKIKAFSDWLIAAAKEEGNAMAGEVVNQA